ncbi:MAG: thiamine phosphate synthase [Lachnospiraceae bacterium]|nr:thiamine phosphate synthase [Lachnospiraceae bacterium]
MYEVYAITDRKYLKNGMSLSQAVALAIDGGASVVQLREKEYEGDALKKLALEIQEVCKEKGATFIINDNVQLAKEIDADGVHLGQSDMNPAEARKVLGKDKIIGVTAKTVGQAKEAEAAGADYLGSGAIFATGTKLDAKPLALEDFVSVCSSVAIPVVAIGGITAENVDYLKNTPMAGVAVVGGIFDTDDIKSETQKIFNLVTSYRK